MIMYVYVYESQQISLEEASRDALVLLPAHSWHSSTSVILNSCILIVLKEPLFSIPRV